jgi:hypothetical protein
MDPLSLVSRLAAAVHPPRFHSIRYGGILAPHAKWRPFVIPPPTPETDASSPTEDLSHSLPMAKNPRPATHRCGYVPWQRLMRQLGIDVETCPRCGGKMKVIALVRDPQGIARYLRHLGLPTEEAPMAPARGPDHPSGRAASYAAATASHPTRPRRRPPQNPPGPPRSPPPPAGGQGHLCLETGNQPRGAWVLAGIRPHPAPRRHPRDPGHEATTPIKTPRGLLYRLRPESAYPPIPPTELRRSWPRSAAARPRAQRQGPRSIRECLPARAG